MQEKNPLIQVLLGPRQVGKTTTLKHLFEQNRDRYLYANADGIPLASWIQEQWQQAQLEGKILIIDEIQKIENWSEMIKKLWDETQFKNKVQKCILAGSSSLQLNQGLTESLAGRFELIQAWHWNFQISQKLYPFTLNEFLYYGGYPGSYLYINESQRFKDYIRTSIIESVITQDLLTQVYIKKPALFRQCFAIITHYPAQVLSYNKLLGQLQDKGNIDIVKYYLELFEQAFLIKQIYNYSKNEIRKKSSSPKIIFMAPVLNHFYSQEIPHTHYLGHVFESLVGATLFKAGIELYYWAEGSYEIDFVFHFQRELIAIEVKSSRPKKNKSIEVFQKKFPQAKIIYIHEENFESFEAHVSDFLSRFI